MAPRKQRHTVKRIYDWLLDEHDAIDISYQMVRTYVAERREEIRLQAGKGVVDTFVPQTHRTGAEAEVYFGDVTIKLAGKLVTCYLEELRGAVTETTDVEVSYLEPTYRELGVILNDQVRRRFDDAKAFHHSV
ncbi:hypothetical protein [Streptomyces sp. NPDC056549]|uniref:hypothetical protein n=1 Tax=Streptomyces sp. NPDC056549 TaxID=3345864 RepID=UPI0036C57FD8